VRPIGTRLGTGLFGGETPRTLKLLKLHGSVNWFYTGRPQFYGETIYDIDQAPGWGRDDWQDLKQRAPDLVPFIVPPTLSKTDFFNNEAVRSQWRLAANALKSASRHFYIGFSFPQTEQLFRSLVSPLSEGREAIIVNKVRDAEAVDALLKRYEPAYPRGRVNADFLGVEDVVPDFASAYVDIESRES